MKMTGKQALYDLIDEIKYTHNDGVSLTQFDQKRVDAIMKDLEVLEQIKVKTDEEIKRQEKVIIEYDNYAWKTQQLNTEFLIAIRVKNILEQIKEWLDNDK